MCSVVETTWWKLPPRKGAFIAATAVTDETRPALACLLLYRSWGLGLHFYPGQVVSLKILKLVSSENLYQKSANSVPEC